MWSARRIKTGGGPGKYSAQLTIYHHHLLPYTNT